MALSEASCSESTLFSKDVKSFEKKIMHTVGLLRQIQESINFV